MKMHFKQRIFSWFDSYDIYDDDENTLYVVKGQLAWGHCLKIFDGHGNEIGTVKERILTILPKFEVYMGGQYVGSISKRLTLFTPKFDIDYKNWHVEGDFFEWNYKIKNEDNEVIATVSKELFHLTDNYTIDVENNDDALSALALILAIDAEKCSKEQMYINKLQYEKETKKSAVSKNNVLNYKYIDEEKQLEEKVGEEND